MTMPDPTPDPAVLSDARACATAIAQKLMVEYFGPGKSSSMPSVWVIEAMLAFAKEATPPEWALVNRLRDEEADSVAILCDNPDGPPNNAVECCGFWTGFADKRFEGATIVEALSLAVAAKDEADRVGHPPMNPPASDAPASGAGEDAVDFAARVLWADGQRRLKQGQSDLPRTRTDFRAAARALFDHPALAAAAPKVASEAAGLRDAAVKAHLFAVTTMAFLGRDRGTDRQDGMLDDLQREAASIDTMLRKALTHPTPSGASGEGTKS